MDKISQLLQEAKPLYLKKQREKRIFWRTAATFCLLLGIWVMQPQKNPFDEEGFDNYFTALYLQDLSVGEDMTFDSAIPFDCYGLYEV